MITEKKKIYKIYTLDLTDRSQLHNYSELQECIKIHHKKNKNSDIDFLLQVIGFFYLVRDAIKLQLEEKIECVFLKTDVFPIRISYLNDNEIDRGDVRILSKEYIELTEEYVIDYVSKLEWANPNKTYYIDDGFSGTVAF